MRTMPSSRPLPGAASSGELESPEVDYVSNVEFSKTPVVAYRLSAGE